MHKTCSMSGRYLRSGCGGRFGTLTRCEEIRQGTTHYIRAIPEQGGRFLRVVVNTRVRPNQVVTLFFDRRLGRHR